MQSPAHDDFAFFGHCKGFLVNAVVMLYAFFKRTRLICPFFIAVNDFIYFFLQSM
jgi:hypothetical protein